MLRASVILGTFTPLKIKSKRLFPPIIDTEHRIVGDRGRRTLRELWRTENNDTKRPLAYVGDMGVIAIYLQVQF